MAALEKIRICPLHLLPTKVQELGASISLNLFIPRVPSLTWPNLWRYLGKISTLVELQSKVASPLHHHLQATPLTLTLLLFRYITWIDRDPETIARQEALKKRDKMQKDDEERMAEFIRSQVGQFCPLLVPTFLSSELYRCVLCKYFPWCDWWFNHRKLLWVQWWGAWLAMSRPRFESYPLKWKKGDTTVPKKGSE